MLHVEGGRMDIELDSSRRFVRYQIALNHGWIRPAFCASFLLTVCGCAGTISPASSTPGAPNVGEGLVVFGDSLTCGGQGNAYGQSTQRKCSGRESSPCHSR